MDKIFLMLTLFLALAGCGTKVSETPKPTQYKGESKVIETFPAKAVIINAYYDKEEKMRAFTFDKERVRVLMSFDHMIVKTKYKKVDEKFTESDFANLDIDSMASSEELAKKQYTFYSGDDTSEKGFLNKIFLIDTIEVNGKLSPERSFFFWIICDEALAQIENSPDPLCPTGEYKIHFKVMK
jgi:hypothetical protein